MTEAYTWVNIAAMTTYGRRQRLTIPSPELAARYGQSIEFKLTVTDDDTPSGYLPV